MDKLSKKREPVSFLDAYESVYKGLRDGACALMQSYETPMELVEFSRMADGTFRAHALVRPGFVTDAYLDKSGRLHLVATRYASGEQLGHFHVIVLDCHHVLDDDIASDAVQELVMMFLPGGEEVFDAAVCIFRCSGVVEDGFKTEYRNRQ